ncbi:hypothetical protein ACRPLQ_25405 [Priestia sp. TRN 1309]|uniref:hypothetical protein n=1 Tax=Priestia sp. TRN 1309 TaxID=3420729 RepID=UPI003D773A1C
MPTPQDTFFNDIVPFFTKIQRRLVEATQSNQKWRDFFSSMRLVLIHDENYNVVDSSQSKFWIYLSTTRDEHSFSTEKEDDFGYASGTDSLSHINLTIIDKIRSFFIYEIVKKAKPIQIAEYFYNMYRNFYPDIPLEKKDNYAKFSLHNWDFESGIFAFTATRINVIFPLQDQLISEDIIDHTGGNRKILIINAEKEKAEKQFTGFDEIIDISDIIFTISEFNFTSSIDFYQKVASLETKEIFGVFDILKTTVITEIYQLQKELVDIPESNGNAFEDYVEKFLDICFSPYYEEFNLRVQNSNIDGVRRRDFIIDNSNSNNAFLRKLEAKNCEFLLFDAKNYKEPLSMRDLDTFTSYLNENPFFGNIGIIFARNGLKDNAKDSLVRNLARNQVKILILDQDDMLSMLDFIDRGKNPLSIIENKYKELLLQL